MIELFSYQFVQFAFIAGILVAVLCALTGIGVVARNMSLLGDSLSHISFGAAAVAITLGLPFAIVTVPTAILASLFVTKFSNRNNYLADAIVAAISTVGISIGVLVASLSKKINIDVESFLFGSILTIDLADIFILAFLTILISVAFFILRKQIFSVLFDAEQAKISGLNVSMYQTVMSVVTGIVIALSMKIVGALLVSALLVLPAFSAMKIASGFSKSIVLSVLFSLGSVTFGMLLSFSLNVPTGPTIALCASFIFLVALISTKE